ncbi:MFS general substrate transporter [Mytilinidion resinicola]|uniref:MFS general substrate transporter n=1 Tax=Mytilinidion resinicola TaxID=574789 RepID=A0A6A6YLL7_9PEZI|nr:MFS general substrate transporter [Mytilinidion resinicola]KAF2809439.1 MFS general substrate transporter [Mytilinidion resinicola]
MASNLTTIEDGDGQEFIIEVKVRPNQHQLRRIQSPSHAEEPSTQNGPDTLNTLSRNPWRSTVIDRPDSIYEPPSRDSVRRSLNRNASTTSRLSKRMSRASDTFYAAVEYNTDEPPQQPTKYGMHFYLILFALSITNVLVALEGTVTSTALPTIVRALGGGSSYVWASSGYFLASTVLQPLYGQMADIFGRRILIIFAVCAFILGSGISGGAPSMEILIFGRVVQGVGGGGINMLVNLIVCDLVPLRDRGKFMAVIFSAISVGTGLGPFLGGVIVQSTTWRWVFYLNIPVGAVSLVLLILFLKVKAPTEKTTWPEKLARIDLAGNVIFVTGVSFILVALAYAGTLWPWKSYNTIVTLLFGFSAIVVFLFYEESSYCLHPTMPLRLFRNRTSATAFVITFIHSLLTLLVIYFLPVYFQAVLLSSPTRSGVQMLPTVIVLVPFSAISGALLSKLGRYKPFHLAGFSVMTVGLGCFITLSARSPTVAWIMVQFVVALGSGFVLSTLLPAAQAQLDDKDTAAATATWAFVRQFGVVWGVSVPAAIFNSQIEHLLPRIDDAGVRATLAGGAAYDHGTKEFISGFSNPLRGQIISMYSDSLKIVWIFATAMAGLGFLLVFLEKEVKLRTQQKTEYGLDE